MSKLEARSILERYQPAIGLEVHCQLKTKSKLFCSCSTEFGASPNKHICPVCVGAPGVLPVVNKEAINYAIKMALAIKGSIKPQSVFARKQYFYPDLPKGYQITQFDKPYCEGGHIVLSCGKKILLERIHIEEDAGKSIHTNDGSFIDLNRAGIPLLEIVSTPTISSPLEASEYLKKLRSIVRYLNISDGNLEEGSFRCDANISISPTESTVLGTRCEIKNLNSFRNIEKSIVYEIMRQADVLDSGGKIKQTTLLWDAAASRTREMRSKEVSDDYRYFPDPDLLPLVIEEERVQNIQKSIPELPEEKTKRFIESYKISQEEALVLTSDINVSKFFESILIPLKDKIAPAKVAHWVCGEFMRAVKEKQWSWKSLPVDQKYFVGLLTMVAKKELSVLAAKQVFRAMVEKNIDPQKLAKTMGLLQLSNATEIEKTVQSILKDNPKQVQDYIAGKEKLYGFFFGQVMRKGQGRFNPEVVESVLKTNFNHLMSHK